MLSGSRWLCLTPPDLSLQLATPWSTEAPGFVSDMLRPFSPYKVQSLADFSSRVPPTAPSCSTAEARHVRCFQKVVLCKITDRLYSPSPGLRGAAPEYVYDWYQKEGLLPTNPAGFTYSGDTHEATTRIRVLVETRPGTVRNLENKESLIRQCNEAGGPWECRPWPMGSDFAR
jgi:hypothetical protein